MSFLDSPLLPWLIVLYPFVVILLFIIKTWIRERNWSKSDKYDFYVNERGELKLRDRLV